MKSELKTTEQPLTACEKQSATKEELIESIKVAWALN